jgi:hypothetical protein
MGIICSSKPLPAPILPQSYPNFPVYFLEAHTQARADIKKEALMSLFFGGGGGISELF